MEYTRIGPIIRKVTSSRVRNTHLVDSKGLETSRVSQKAAGVDVDKLGLDADTSPCQTHYRTQDICLRKSRPYKPTVMPKGQSSLHSGVNPNAVSKGRAILRLYEAPDSRSLITTSSSYMIRGRDEVYLE